MSYVCSVCGMFHPPGTECLLAIHPDYAGSVERKPGAIEANLEALRRLVVQIDERLKRLERPRRERRAPPNPPPRYDEVYFEGTATLNKAEDRPPIDADEPAITEGYK